MPKIKFQLNTGESVDVVASSGSTLMETAIAESIAGIDGECGGACACGTCHVAIDKQWQAIVGAPDDYEREMLEALESNTGASRLACQIAVRDELDGLVVTVIPAGE